MTYVVMMDEFLGGKERAEARDAFDRYLTTGSVFHGAPDNPVN